ncbi:hypothetical protein Fmac_002826 [Flemingia macrophylla]|uniref:Uncharacterized protein n=1 Tax=Flemingia macrophylla TaxID=520843 RepID=A0ABD1NLP5_9FABA
MNFIKKECTEIEMDITEQHQNAVTYNFKKSMAMLIQRRIYKIRSFWTIYNMIEMRSATNFFRDAPGPDEFDLIIDYKRVDTMSNFYFSVTSRRELLSNLRTVFHSSHHERFRSENLLRKRGAGQGVTNCGQRGTDSQKKERGQWAAADSPQRGGVNGGQRRTTSTKAGEAKNGRESEKPRTREKREEEDNPRIKQIRGKLPNYDDDKLQHIPLGLMTVTDRAISRDLKP